MYVPEPKVDVQSNRTLFGAGENHSQGVPSGDIDNNSGTRMSSPTNNEVLLSPQQQPRDFPVLSGGAGISGGKKHPSSYMQHSNNPTHGALKSKYEHFTVGDNQSYFDSHVFNSANAHSTAPHYIFGDPSGGMSVPEVAGQLEQFSAAAGTAAAHGPNAAASSPIVPSHDQNTGGAMRVGSIISQSGSVHGDHAKGGNHTDTIQLVWVANTRLGGATWPGIVIPASDNLSDLADLNTLVWLFGTHEYMWVGNGGSVPFDSQMYQQKSMEFRSCAHRGLLNIAEAELSNFLVLGVLPRELQHGAYSDPNSPITMQRNSLAGPINAFASMGLGEHPGYGGVAGTSGNFGMHGMGPANHTLYQNNSIGALGLSGGQMPLSNEAGSSGEKERPSKLAKEQKPKGGDRQRKYNYEKVFQCSESECSKEFSTSVSLQRHLKTHQGKRFVCEEDGCGKKFYYRSHLTRHELVHSGEKPFQCGFDDCNKEFTDIPSLNRHKLTHTGERSHKCTFEGCDKAFTLAHHLRYHIRTHTNEKPFECTWATCDKRFARKDNMVSHLRIHTGEKPFKCDIDDCEEKFTRSSDCLKHKKTHFGVKPFECIVKNCDKSFARLADLKRHRLKVHDSKIKQGDSPASSSE
eukprot:Nk52_evm5s70 gene=Nk52_evmTU5s70